MELSIVVSQPVDSPGDCSDTRTDRTRAVHRQRGQNNLILVPGYSILNHLSNSCFRGQTKQLDQRVCQSESFCNINNMGRRCNDVEDGSAEDVYARTTVLFVCISCICMQTSPVVLPDRENMGIAVVMPLLWCIRAEIYAISYLLPAAIFDLRHSHTSESILTCSSVFSGTKTQYGRWNRVAILYISRDKYNYIISAAILHAWLPVFVCKCYW